MPKKTDVHCVGASVYLLPVEMRVPLKFGAESVSHVTCARVRVAVEDRLGNRAVGWGETPLSVTWAWPSRLTYDERHEAMVTFCMGLTRAWTRFEDSGHPMELGSEFLEEWLPMLEMSFNAGRSTCEPMPWLAALVCCSAFDIALHDAYGVLHGKPVYETYTAEYMNEDLSWFMRPEKGSGVSFKGKYPADFLCQPREKLAAWHLVGGLDPLDESELTGEEPKDEYPVVLGDWIERDGLKCLKVKLRGDDAQWDYERLVKVGTLAAERGVERLTADFNCMVTDPEYVNGILDRLKSEQPGIHEAILYVEQPFAYDLEENRIDVHSVSKRKPLFMDESAHDWRLVQLGRRLGWTGVALKTCKTQTGALLSLCWAKAHGMALMVQDLTNPMLAQIPHVLLAAHADTIMGVESNGMQFYPDASLPEQAVHPGLYQRRDGMLDLSTISGPGFGYRLDEMARQMLMPAAEHGVF